MSFIGTCKSWQPYVRPDISENGEHIEKYRIKEETKSKQLRLLKRDFSTLGYTVTAVCNTKSLNVKLGFIECDSNVDHPICNKV